ncbi:hypothetical protein BgiBS90_036642 [Biomphalaria glabrata]|nr:hypothetical protein BgiBS90_036642 [Biomphalaria glabrata]
MRLQMSGTASSVPSTAPRKAPELGHELTAPEARLLRGTVAIVSSWRADNEVSGTTSMFTDAYDFLISKMAGDSRKVSERGWGGGVSAETFAGRQKWR